MNAAEHESVIRPTQFLATLRLKGRVPIRPTIVVLALLATLTSTVAEAQWVLLARRAVGRVEQMSQQSKESGATYDTAAVILEVPADKVYATMKRSLEAARTSQGITIPRVDDANKAIEFS